MIVYVTDRNSGRRNLHMKICHNTIGIERDIIQKGKPVIVYGLPAKLAVLGRKRTDGITITDSTRLRSVAQQSIGRAHCPQHIEVHATDIAHVGLEIKVIPILRIAVLQKSLGALL